MQLQWSVSHDDRLRRKAAERWRASATRLRLFCRRRAMGSMHRDVGADHRRCQSTDFLRCRSSAGPRQAPDGLQVRSAWDARCLAHRRAEGQGVLSVARGPRAEPEPHETKVIPERMENACAAGRSRNQRARARGRREPRPLRGSFDRHARTRHQSRRQNAHVPGGSCG